QFYISFYDDLRHFENYDQAYWHWIHNGIHENRFGSTKMLDDYNNKSKPKTNRIPKSNSPMININAYEKINLFYYVGTTCEFVSNTGIQRVVRLLGKHLEQKCNLYLMKFDFHKSEFINLNDNDKYHL